MKCEHEFKYHDSYNKEILDDVHCCKCEIYIHDYVNQLESRLAIAIEALENVTGCHECGVQYEVKEVLNKLKEMK